MCPGRPGGSDDDNDSGSCGRSGVIGVARNLPGAPLVAHGELGEISGICWDGSAGGGMAGKIGSGGEGDNGGGERAGGVATKRAELVGDCSFDGRLVRSPIDKASAEPRGEESEAPPLLPAHVLSAKPAARGGERW